MFSCILCRRGSLKIFTLLVLVPPLGVCGINGTLQVHTFWNAVRSLFILPFSHFLQPFLRASQGFQWTWTLFRALHMHLTRVCIFVFIPPCPYLQFVCWNLDTKVMVFWRGNLVTKAEPWWTGFLPLKKRLQRAPSLLAPCEDTVRGWHLQPRAEPFLEWDHAGMLILDIQPEELWG